MIIIVDFLNYIWPFILLKIMYSIMICSASKEKLNMSYNFTYLNEYFE
jgi:hypothetical protein